MGNAAVQTGKRATYPAYKPSRMNWVGDVPEHWDVRRLKYTASINDEALPETTDPDYEFTYVDIGSVDASKGIVSTETYRFEDAPSRARRIVREGDTIVSTVRTYLRAIAAIHEPAENLIVSTGFAVVRPRSLEPGYLSYALRSPFFVETVVSRSTGVSYPAINAPEVGNIGVTLPPLDEQKAIAAFLDRETARIDTLIEKKRRQIELLQEKRSALISHAVTKGLDPNAPMKDSGIEWLGQIPQHWKLLPLKRVSQLQTGLTLGKKYEDCELVRRPYLRVANVQDGYLDLNTITEVELPAEELKRYELQRGDVLMTEGGDFDKLGRGYVWDAQIPGCLHQNHIFCVRCDARSLHPLYLAWMTSSSHGKAYFTSTAQQTTNLASTNSFKIKAFPALLPPVGEQEAIIQNIFENTSQIDALILKVEESAATLREHRSALISAAVTGKIDVRGEVA
jgi:type I restriction enzyme S subunit